MARDTDVQGIAVGLASVEARVMQLDERIATGLERMEERLAGHDQLLTYKFDLAVGRALEPITKKLETLEEAQAEAKVAFRTAGRIALILAGGLSSLWGVVEFAARFVR